MYLGSELESVKAMFREKENELGAAARRAAELHAQLEQLRQGNGLATLAPPSLAQELNRLRHELMVSLQLVESRSCKY